MNDAATSSMVESSVVARWVRHVAGGSVVVRVLQDGVRRSSAAMSPVRRAIASGRSPRPAADGRRLVEGSRLLEQVESSFLLIGLAWREATRTGILAPVVRDVMALHAAERVRLSGWVLLIAALTVAGWRARHDLAASWSIALSVVMMFAAIALMKWNVVIATAWIDRRGGVRQETTGTRSGAA